MSSAGRKEDCNPGLLLTHPKYMTCDDGGYWVVTYYYLVSCIKFVSWLSFERRIQGNAICEPHPPALFCPGGMGWWWRGEGWELFGKKWDFLKIILHREFLSLSLFPWSDLPVQWTGHNPITNTHSLSLSSLCVLGCGGGHFVRAENCYRAALDIWIDSSLALPWFPVDVTVIYSVQLHLPSLFVFSSPPCLCKHISTGACIKQRNSFYPSYC